MQEHFSEEFDQGRLSEQLEEESNESEKYPFEGGIIVFGHGWSKEAKVGGGWQLSPEAYMRAVAAYQLWHEGLAPRIILTGGMPNKEWAKENFGDVEANSEQMAQLLIKKFHVPEDAIVIETRSVKTVDNVAHALNALQERGLPADDFIVLSTGFHMDRITEIMKKFGLQSLPKTAEEALNQRAQEHAEKIKQREIEKGVLSNQEIEKNYQMQKSRYERVIERFKRTNEVIKNEINEEPTYLKAMRERPGFWLPLALAVRGEKLEELVQTHRTDIET